jgi:hypothetical protein
VCARVCVRLDGESRGVRPLGCMRVCICANVGGVATGATQNRWRVHGDDIETRAQRENLGEAVFRVEVVERFELGVEGSMDSRAPVRWGSRRRQGGMSSTVTDRGSRGLGPSVACVCVRADRRRLGHGSDTKLMASTRQGTRKGEQRRTVRRRWLGTYAGERPRVCVSVRA